MSHPVSRFHDAVMSGRVEEVDAMLGENPDLISLEQNPAEYSSGWKSIHLAAIYGHAAVISLLVARGCPVDRPDDQSMTALHHAAEHAYLDVVSSLLHLGADLWRLDMHGYSPLHRAVMSYGSEPETCRAIIDLLVDRGAELDLYSAIVLGEFREAHRLMAENPVLDEGLFAKALLPVAVIAAWREASGFSDVTDRSRQTCEKAVTLIREMFARRVPLDYFEYALKQSLHHNNTIVAECLLDVGTRQGLLEAIDMQQLAVSIAGYMIVSTAREQFIELFGRYGIDNLKLWSDGQRM